MKKVFFVVPVYKVEDYLERCVNSVLMQTYPNVAIILVDDGSPDKCPQICDELAQKHKNIVVIHKENGGLSDARNAGLSYINENADKDDYITFLDSDDFVSPDFAQTLITLMENNECDIAQCEYEKGDADIFPKSNSCEKTFAVDSQSALLGYNLKSMSCSKVYKVRVFEGITYPLGMQNEDEFVTYKAVFNSKKVLFTNEKLYYYYQHNTGIMKTIAQKLKDNPHKHDYLKAYEERIAFFEEKKLPYQVMKTREKICTDIILRYCEQMYLKKKDRDTDCVNGTYMKIYRENFKMMIKRPGIIFKKKLMYYGFFIMPYTGVIMSKIFGLRK